MEKTLAQLEEEYSRLYKDLFNEISKVQIEEKYMERLAQTLIDDLRRAGDAKLVKLLDEIIENNDPDMILQTEHLNHVNSINTQGDLNIFNQEFGSNDPENFAYTKPAN